jgi:hypothetical protein
MRRLLTLLCLIPLIATACIGTNVPTPTNTAPPVEASETPTEEPTVVPEITQASIPTREPLPPTWTPGGAVGPATSVPVTSAPRMTDVPTATLPASCSDFRADYDRIGNTFVLGTSPTLYWEPAAGAAEYRVYITDPEGEAIWVTTVPGDSTSYDIPADVFDVDPETLGQTVMVFGWELTPIDAEGSRYCPSAGSELIPVADN